MENRASGQGKLIPSKFMVWGTCLMLSRGEWQLSKHLLIT